jgi:hypothetical protein
MVMEVMVDGTVDGNQVKVQISFRNRKFDTHTPPLRGSGVAPGVFPD